MPDNHDIATVNRKGLLPALSGSASDVLLGTGVFGASAVPDPLKLGNGDETAPTYSFTSDTNTGIYRVSADTLGFTTAGVAAWQITSAGAIRGPDAATTSSNGTLRQIQGGPGGSSSGNGGQLQILGGDAGGSGNGGQITLSGGAAAGTNKPGGTIVSTGGQGIGSGAGGSINFNGGSPGLTGGGGSINFTGGPGGATSGISGGLNFASGTTTSGSTGGIDLFIPSPLGTDKDTGDIVLRIGTATGAGAQGNINLKMGTSTTVLRVNGTSFHTSYMGSSPTITAGGGSSPSIVGKDQAFTVTIGTGGVATTFTVTFAKAFTNAPPAVANSDTDIVAFKVATTTTTVIITATAPFTASSKVHVLVGSWE